MLSPIPSGLLTYSADIKVCTGTDNWEKPEWQTYAVSKVHIQASNEMRRTRDNMEVVLKSILFIDGLKSTPSLDYMQLAWESETGGEEMRAVVYDPSGSMIGDFRVVSVDALPDYPSYRIHHYELGLI